MYTNKLVWDNMETREKVKLLRAHVKDQAVKEDPFALFTGGLTERGRALAENVMREGWLSDEVRSVLRCGGTEEEAKAWALFEAETEQRKVRGTVKALRHAFLGTAVWAAGKRVAGLGAGAGG